MRRKIDVSERPNRRTVIRFQFNEEPRPEYPRSWLLADAGAGLPELCACDPGLDIDLFVETSTISLSAIIIGKTTIESETESGRLFLSGDASVARMIDRGFAVLATRR